MDAEAHLILATVETSRRDVSTVAETGPKRTITMKKLIPIIMSASLTIAVCAVAGIRFSNPDAWRTGGTAAPGLVFCAFYVLWLLFETRVSAREDAERYADYGTREFYGAGHAATILCALWFAPGHAGSVLPLCAGAGAFAAGAALRVRAILTLGKFYSHSVRTVEGHRIVDGGPYRVVRHPAYAGMLLAHAGVVAFFFSMPALAVYLLWLVPAIVLRILVEERTLSGIRGYREFASSRKRIIPGIW
jgi:protein-S-isoprenylcysteine O-methyltransferase Ste14